MKGSDKERERGVGGLACGRTEEDGADKDEDEDDVDEDEVDAVGDEAKARSPNASNTVWGKPGVAVITSSEVDEDEYNDDADADNDDNEDNNIACVFV